MKTAVPVPRPVPERHRRLEEPSPQSGERETIESLQEHIVEMAAQMTKMEALLQYYEAQFRLLKRRQFGASSERIYSDCRQLNLFSHVQIAPPPIPDTEEITYKRKKQKGRREEDLSNLHVVRVEHELPEDERGCPSCTGPCAISA